MIKIPREQDKDSGYSTSVEWLKKVQTALFQDKGLANLSLDAMDELMIYLDNNGYLKIEPAHWAERAKDD